MLRQKARKLNRNPTRDRNTCQEDLEESRLPEGEQVEEDQVAFMRLTRLKTDSRMKSWIETCGIAGKILFKIRLMKLWFQDYKTLTVL